MLIDNLFVLDICYGHTTSLKIDLLRLRLLRLLFSQDAQLVFSPVLVLLLSTPLLVLLHLRQPLQRYPKHVTIPLQYGSGRH